MLKRILFLILTALMTIAFFSAAQATSAAPSVRAQEYAVALKGTKLYEANDSKSKVLAVVPAGTIFVIRNSEDGWSYAEDIDKQTVGYVKTSGLTALQPPDEWMQTNAVFINQETSLYPQPKASGKIVTLYPGTRIEILGMIKNYYAIQVGTGKDLLTGYVKKQDGLLIGGGVSKTYREKQVVDTQGDIPVFAGPDAMKYPSIGSLKPDERVSFDKEWGEYSQIIFKDAEGYRVTGYVESKYLCYPFVGTTPVSATSPDGKMRMDLYISDGPYRAGEEILCYAVLSYLGKSSRQVFYASGCLMGFSVIGGKFTSGGIVTSDSQRYVIEKKQPLRVDFSKSGGWSADDPDAAFFEAYYREPKLILPRGEYEITASLGYTYSDEPHRRQFDLSTSKKIKVE